ncbi:MAG: hypothetical protein ABI629_07080 [bacterium]
MNGEDRRRIESEGSSGMASRIIGTLLGVCAVGALVGALVFGLRPQAQEADAPDADEVSPAELDLYIAVYSSMQGDHDLTLDQVLAQKAVPLEQFRNIERRVQRQDRLVRKVRDALTAQAKERAVQVVPTSAKPPDATVAAPAVTPAP